MTRHWVLGVIMRKCGLACGIYLPGSMLDVWTNGIQLHDLPAERLVLRWPSRPYRASGPRLQCHLLRSTISAPSIAMRLLSSIANVTSADQFLRL